VRGYLFGAAWSEYEATGTVGGRRLPAGLRRADRLPEPLFTPTTKAELGDHDEPVTEAEAAALVGSDTYEQVRDASLRLYAEGTRHAEHRGVILADTKFEFGTRDGLILVIDEMMTPDSSRYWPLESWAPGTSPPSFDKQFVRDHMDATGWDHTPPAPAMPADVIAATRAKYVEAYELITGEPFADWFGPDDA
ncbi:MAG: phosphoribosylaminoimidazolesuccinocarboxamide synthase, partial [Actinomycetota bacterium]